MLSQYAFILILSVFGMLLPIAAVSIGWLLGPRRPDPVKNDIYESGMRTSRTHPGINVNLLHDDRVRDTFTGMPVYNGTPCRIELLESG